MQRKSLLGNRTPTVRRPAGKAKASCAASCVRRPSAQKTLSITISPHIRVSFRARRGRPSARQTSSWSIPHHLPLLWRPVARVKPQMRVSVWVSASRTKWFMGGFSSQTAPFPVVRASGRNGTAAGIAVSTLHTRASSPTTSASTRVRNPISVKYACAFSAADPP